MLRRSSSTSGCVILLQRAAVSADCVMSVITPIILKGETDYLMTNPGDLGCSCYKLRQASRLISRTYDSFLAPCALSIGQFGLLATLSACKEIPLAKLAEMLQMDRTTLTRNLLPLEKLGYIKSKRSEDRRLRALSLSASGKVALSEAKPRWREAQRSLEDQLGSTNVALLNRVLDFTVTQFPATTASRIRTERS